MRALSEHDAVRAVDDHFSQLGAQYENAAFGTLGQRWISQRELEAVGTALRAIPRGAKVLDTGAGNGRITRLLTTGGRFSVTALDTIPEMLVAVRQRAPEAMPLLARLGQPIGIRDATFDAVVAMRVLKWVPAWEHAVRELARVLAPGGVLVLEVANRRSLARLGYRNAPVTLRTPKEVRDVGRKAGITWTAAHTGTHLPHPCWNAARAPIALRTLQTVQGIADLFLGSHGARSVVLVGHKD